MMRLQHKSVLAWLVLIAAVSPVAPAAAARGTAGSGVAALTHITMVTADTGWGTTAGAVVKTADGGRTWRRVLTVPKPSPPATNGPYFSFASIGPEGAWVAVTSARGIRTYRTVDGGASWGRSRQSYAGQKQTPGPGELDFADSRDGWLLLHDGAAAGSAPQAILRTTDSGRHWQRVEFNYIARHSRDSLSACDGAAAYLSFVHPLTGFATGWCGSDPRMEEVSGTRDGGRTWRSLTVPAPKFTKMEWFQPGPVIVTSTHGVLLLPVALAGPPEFVLYRSIDGGVSWKPTTPIRGPSPHPRYTGPSFSYGPLDSLTSWVVVGDTLYRTTDGGIVWHVMSRSPRFPWSAELDFVTRRDGFAIRPAGGTRLFVTVDAGRHWRRIVPRLA